MDADYTDQPSITEGDPYNPIDVDITAVVDEESTEVIGNRLWSMKAFLSPKRDGSEVEEILDEQVLSRTQQNIPLEEDRDLFFDRVRVNLDMTDKKCSELKFLCLEFSKNEESSVNYTFKAQPDDSILTKCVHLDPDNTCTGGYFMFCENFIWNIKVLLWTVADICVKKWEQ